VYGHGKANSHVSIWNCVVEKANHLNEKLNEAIQNYIKLIQSFF
jgi:hypothetical protein